MVTVYTSQCQTLISLTFQFECEVVGKVPTLVVAPQEEESVLVVQLQAPQVQDTLQQEMTSC